MTKETMTLIGAEATYHIGSLNVAVIIKDIRRNYGRTDYLIEPQAGSGTQWVKDENIKINGVKSC